MNSLSFLSRQFDVLASARTPPSTPVPQDISGSRHSRSSSHHGSIKRVQTWFTESLLSPQAPHPAYPTPKHPPRRTVSSPADFVDLSFMPSGVPSLVLPVKHDILDPTVEVVTMQPRSRRSRFHAAFRRIFFIQVFVLLWEALYAGWTSLTARAPISVHRRFTPSDDESTTSDEDQKDRASIPNPALPIPPLTTVDHRFTNPPAIVDYTPSGPSTTSQSSRMYSLATLTHPDISFSRESTPSSSVAKGPRGVAVPKTLVLDLDETLIHSTSRPMQMGSSWNLRSLFNFGKRNKGTGHTVEVILDGKRTLYHVYKRPFVDFFLRTVSGWYTLVVFTASMQEYADPVIDWLDAGRGILAQRLFRDSCTQLPNGSYTKDLAVVEADLSRVCLLDNSPICYKINEANGIPIEGWTDDPSDEALLDLLPILDSLRFTSDVRRVLGIRGFS